MGVSSHWIQAGERALEHYQHQELQEEQPSAIRYRNMFVCQVEEHIGLNLLGYIGADKVSWELDYSHLDILWPHAQEQTQSVFFNAGISNEEVEMITHRNSEQLFRWTPAELPEAVSVRG